MSCARMQWAGPECSELCQNAVNWAGLQRVERCCNGLGRDKRQTWIVDVCCIHISRPVFVNLCPFAWVSAYSDSGGGVWYSSKYLGRALSQNEAKQGAAFFDCLSVRRQQASRELTWCINIADGRRVWSSFLRHLGSEAFVLAEYSLCV